MTRSGERTIYRAKDGGGEAAQLRRGVAVACAAVIALVAAGCSVTFPIGSLLDTGEEPLVTGSIKPIDVSPLSPELAGEDWRRAKSALAVALDPKGNGSSVSWDNPESGFKGSFVPVGRPFVSNDEICRVFLADLSLRSSKSSLQGTACRPSGGEWTVKDVKPWKKPA
ncbi:RT0821/Lpp0805 family surface protein [Chelatococcus albus]|uniref:RT0821/Lpp0805 family surface protein n=1 Tax=Chelatococcus albus TaxID=3047466 RepID=UPI0024BC471C|nr:RT0821/Lpp0805 family surface protein [Chelatococcus sp. SYSU_G07232]